MQSHLFRVSFVLFLCYLAIGCSQPPTNGAFIARSTNEPTTSPVILTPTHMENVISIWLSESEKCLATCWNGITIPQEWEQGYRLLQKEESITLGVVEESIINNQIQGGMAWRSTSESTIQGEIFYKGDPRQIYLVAIYPNETILLQDIIDILGEPTHIYAFANECFDADCINIGLNIIYLDKGIALDGHIFSPASDEATYSFDGDWNAFSILFFEPTEQGLGLALTRGHTTNLDGFQPWRGLLPFHEYCQGNACDLVK